MQASEFFNVSSRMVNACNKATEQAPGAREAELRTALGRCYYAMLHVVRERARNAGVAVSQAESVHAVAAAFLRTLVEEKHVSSFMHKRFALAMVQRLGADYEIERPTMPADASRVTVTRLPIDVSNVQTSVQRLVEPMKRLPAELQALSDEFVRTRWDDAVRSVAESRTRRPSRSVGSTARSRRRR